MDDARFPVPPPDADWQAANPGWNELPPDDKRWRPARGDKSGNLGPTVSDPASNLVRRILPKIPIQQIPPRQWLYGHFLLVGHAACLAAVDGGGKGAMAVAMALAVITGKPLLGDKVHRTGQVMIVTYEDKLEEWQRRIAAACMHYDLDYDVILDHIAFLDKASGLIAFAQPNPREGGPISCADADDIISEMKDFGAVLLIVDPLNRAHGFDDGNNNVAMAQVAGAMDRVAGEAQAAVLVLHHLRKGSTGIADDMMGATSVRATFRSSRVLAKMQKVEGEALGIKEDHWRYSRISGSKDNYAPPPDEAVWFKLESVLLGNVTPDYPNGDSIQVTTPWQCRPTFEGLDHAKLTIIFDNLKTSIYSPRTQAENWIGKLLMDIGGRSRVEARTILSKWVESGTITTEDYTTESRNRTQKVVLDGQKATEILNSLAPRSVDFG